MKILLAIPSDDWRPEAVWLLETLFAGVAPEVALDVCAIGGGLAERVDHETALLTWAPAFVDSAMLPRRPALEIHIPPAAETPAALAALRPAGPPVEMAHDDCFAVTFFGGGVISHSAAGGMNRWTLEGDLLATAFFCLSRAEEWGSGGPRDAFDRFPDRNNYIVRHGFAGRPVVDEIRVLLDALIARAWRTVPRHSPWNGRPAAFFLSHDIDQVRYSTIKGLVRHPWRTARLTGRRGPAIASLRLALHGFAHPRRDPYFSYYYLQRLYRHLHILGTFFVIPRRTGRLEPYDLLREKRLTQALTALAVRVNAEIGLHATFAGARDGAELERDIAAFNQAFAYRPDGARSHYLRFFWPETLRALEAAGVHYDSTLGFSAIEGFRCGTCRPYYLFDVERRRATAVLEIPLLLMDATLLYHRRLAPAEAREKSLALLRTVRTYNGVCALLWHTEALLCPLWAPWRRETLLPLLRDALREDFAFLTGETINQICRAAYRRVG